MAAEQNRDPQRRARIQRMLHEIERQLEQDAPDPDQTLEQIEKQVEQLGRKLREVIERETLASLGNGLVGSHTSCACGHLARYVAVRPRQLVTLNGCQRLHRAYYHCAHCERGFCRLDQKLSLGRGPQSVGVRTLAARFASYLPFAKAAEELEVATGIRLGARTVHRDAQSVGEMLATTWQEREEALWAGKAPPPTQRPVQLHASMDGTMIFVAGEWREARIGVFYRRDEGGGVARAQYTADRVNSVTFGKRMRTLGQREGVGYCRKLGMLGDGADWIWAETAKHFPQATEILDFYHGSQYLWEAARAQHEEEKAAAEWVERQTEKLLADGVSEVIVAVEGWEASREADVEVKRRVGNYLREQEGRMRYETYQKEGYHIGSGVVEAGGKSVIQARMKGAGMRWGEKGARAMLHLRAAWCSTDRSDFLTAARRAATFSQS